MTLFRLSFTTVPEAKKKECAKMASNVDIAFMLDATASMGKNIRNTKNNIGRIVRQVKAAFPNAKVRMGLVAYRDWTDSRRVNRRGRGHFKIRNFTSDVRGFVRTVGSIRATGGGDYTEDVIGALGKTLKLNWKAANKIIFQIGEVNTFPNE